MKIGPYIGCAVLVMVFGGAILGMLIRRKLPESHLSDESKGVVTLSMGVVGTLTALVLSLLIATASGTFNTRNQEITVIAAKVIQLDRLLRRFGPETASLRVLLRRYTTMRFQDLFPQGSAKPVLQNSNTITLFEDLEDQLAAMEGHNAQQPLVGVAGSGTDGRPDGDTVALSRAGGARNPSSGAAGGFILAVPAFHEFRPVRTP